MIVNVTSVIDPVAVCFSADLFLMSHKQTFRHTETLLGRLLVKMTIVKCIGDILTIFLHITAKKSFPETNTPCLLWK